MEIFDCEQGSPEWFAARMGVPTASEFKTLLSGTKDAKDKKTRATYMQKLAGEIITGEPMENYSNGHMERGKMMEDEARNYYAISAEGELQRVGFVKADGCGCSPDSLIGTNGILEIKTALPHILIELIEKDDFPPAHKAQCQGALFVSGRRFVDLVVYWPKMPRFVKRAYRDEAYIEEIAAGVRVFNDELAAMVKRIRGYGARAAA